MSKEGRLEIGHSASEAIRRRGNKSISAKVLNAMVLKTYEGGYYGDKAKGKNGAYVFGRVAVIFTLISARKPSKALTPVTLTVILWFMPSFVLAARYPVKYCMSL